MGSDFATVESHSIILDVTKGDTVINQNILGARSAARNLP